MNQVALFLGRLLFVALVPASPTLLAEDLLPEADGTVRGGRYADAANIPGQSLVVKNSRFAEFDRWSYLKFDLSKVDAEIVRATLVLSVRHTDGTTTLDVHATHDRWDPRNVRWNRRPVPDAAVATATVRDDRDIILDVTDYVRAEARGDRAASFVLSVPHANERYLSFGSRKSQAAPLLMIDTRASFASGHRQPPRATVPVASRAPQVLSWTACANENQICTLPGADNEARQIRFGTGNQFVVRTFFRANHWLGDVSCSVTVFGSDPAPGQTKRCEYSSVLVKELPAPTHPMGPAIDLEAIPVGDPGSAQALIRTTPEPPAPSDIGAFRTICTFSHMNFDDPIVYPGQVGRSHLHTFFGNAGATGNSTRASIANSGNSTCMGGVLNRSAYWVPSVIDTRTGRPIAPKYNVIYYKTGYQIPSSQISPFPDGLRMITGDMRASSTQPIPSSGWWCAADGAPLTGSIPANCVAGSTLELVLQFPQCWDGQNLDSPDHKSHMAYPADGRCPSTHPVALTDIAYHVHYPVPDGTATSFWRLSSDMYGADRPGGFSLHGDWFNGWDTAIQTTWTQRCNAASLDCHSALIGDGREIYYDAARHQIDPTLSNGSRPRVRSRP